MSGGAVGTDRTDRTGWSVTFVGRGRELREVTAFLAANQCVSLIGLPGMGKSAILQQLAQGGVLGALCPSTAMLCAYVDCAELRESAPAEVFRQFAVALAVSVEHDALSVEPAVVEAIAQPSRLVFESAIRRLNGRGLQVVLALDTFEALSTINKPGIPLFNALRAAAGRFKLAFLTASSRPLIDLTHGAWSPELYSSPFFNIFASITIGPMPKAEALLMIRLLRLERGDVESQAGDDALYTLVGGYPHALVIASRHAAEQLDDSDEIARRIERALRPSYELLWQQLTNAERGLLRRCVDGAIVARQDSAGRVCLQALALKGLLIATGETSYRLASRSWDHFVTAVGDS